MSEDVLEWAAYPRRVRRVAVEAGCDPALAYVSIPLLRPRPGAVEPDGHPPKLGSGGATAGLSGSDDRVPTADLVSALCRLDALQDALDPVLAPPTASVCMSPTGQSIAVEQLATSGSAGGPGLRRWAGEATAMSPEEREAFAEVYFLLLTAEDGPMWLPWSELGTRILNDLRTLLDVVGEPACRSVWGRLCPEFVQLLGVDVGAHLPRVPGASE